jgi:hypothetical protein
VHGPAYIRLPRPAREALYELAEQEWRDPRDQAALFVVEGLRRAGALPSDQADTDSGPTAALEAVK